LGRSWNIQVLNTRNRELFLALPMLSSDFQPPLDHISDFQIRFVSLKLPGSFRPQEAAHRKSLSMVHYLLGKIFSKFQEKGANLELH